MKRFLRYAARCVPAVQRLIDERNGLSEEVDRWKQKSRFPPGHYYSPIPSDEDVEQHFGSNRTDCYNISGVDSNLAVQDRHWGIVSRYYDTQPFLVTSDDNRYIFQNEAFAHSDALILQGLMRALQPRRIVEIGSGHSSAAMLDINDKFLDGHTHFTFIDPYPERLDRLLRDSDRHATTILRQRVQDVDSAPWDRLEANDFLFIDSSHTCKCGGDVNRIIFEIMPRLAPGVYVHIHDIFPGFEYPRTWIESGRAWNEAYVVRAFLMFNSEFEIVIWGPQMVDRHREECAKRMPLMLENTGASLWLRRRTKAFQVPIDQELATPRH